MPPYSARMGASAETRPPLEAEAVTLFPSILKESGSRFDTTTSFEWGRLMRSSPRHCPGRFALPQHRSMHRERPEGGRVGAANTPRPFHAPVRAQAWSGLEGA